MLGSISPRSPELVGSWHWGTAGWKPREIPQHPAGAIKPRDLVLIKVPPQRKGRRWKTNSLHPPAGCRWAERSPASPSLPSTARARRTLPEFPRPREFPQPPDRELAASADASGCDGRL